jgi:hypothetical protein
MIWISEGGSWKRHSVAEGLFFAFAGVKNRSERNGKGEIQGALHCNG